MIPHPKYDPLHRTAARRSAKLNMATLAALACLIAGPAFADLRMEGRFQGRGEGKLGLNVFVLNPGDPKTGYFVQADTSVPNVCSGDLRGTARQIDETTLRLTSTPEDGEEACELTLRFSPDRNRVTMTSKSCSNFHGASCDFVGRLRRR